MKEIVLVITTLFFGLFTGPKKTLPEHKVKDLQKYTIENLSKVDVNPSKIEIGEVLLDKKDFTSSIFSFNFDPTLQKNSGQQTKKVTGLVNIPKGDKTYPLILMIRGYVDQKMYTSGVGTKKASEFFADNGFITISPDFLGYAGSDKESENIFESRFQTYTTVLSLLASVKNIQAWDKKNIFLWAHSNGGQIVLTVLEITSRSFPTVLWAPVSKFFPYSILYYTNESDDHGKLIRSELAKFEADYDTDLFSLDKYFTKVVAPIQVDQGTSDDAVPVKWSDELVKNLKANSLKVNYFKYVGADHNLQPSWNTVIQKDLLFFKNHIY